MTELDLHQRDQLPDALRVLLADYPRDTWETDPGFEGTVRFWLDRHLMFRRILGNLQSDAQAIIDRKMPGKHYANALSRMGGMFVNGLHEHHTIEDTYYFPKLAVMDQRITTGFDILDKDHHAIDAELNAFVGTANDILQRRDDDHQMRERAARFAAQLDGLHQLLDRHLTDEEELIVPVILRYGAPAIG